MTFRWAVVVGGQEGVGGGKVWAGTLGEPPNGSNNALIPPSTFDEGRAVISFIGFRAGIDGKARPVGSGIRGDSACMNIVVFDKMSSKSGLAEMYGNLASNARPLKVGPEKPVDCPHELDCNKTRQKPFEVSFDGSITAEVDEVVHVKTNCERVRRERRSRIIGIAEAAREHAWVWYIGVESEVPEDGSDFVIPMTWAATEAVESFLK
jgi:hypothetical protein